MLKSDLVKRHLAILEDTSPIKRNFLAFKSQLSCANELIFKCSAKFITPLLQCKNSV